MVHIRADDLIGIAVTEGSGGIPAYAFSTVGKAAGAKPAILEPYEYAARSAREVTAVFRKYYGADAGKDDPRKRGAKILMAVMAGVVLIFSFVFVSLSRRRQALAA